MILKAIHNLLSRDDAITADVSDRIMPVGMDQDATLPYLTFQLITTDATEHLAGSAGLARATIQINVWAATFSDADRIAENIRLATQGFSGVVDDAITVDRVHLDDLRDSSTAPVDGAGQYLSGKQIDLGAWYTHTAPSFN